MVIRVPRGGVRGLVLVFASLAWSFVSVTAVPAATALQAKGSVDTAYDIAVKSGVQPKSATPIYQAENPANNLRLEFGANGIVAVPAVSVGPTWSLDLRLLNISFQGTQTPLGAPKLSASGHDVAYDFGNASV